MASAAAKPSRIRLMSEDGSYISFRHLEHAKLLAMDIGGSLAKIAYYSTVSVKRPVYQVSLEDDDDDNNKKYEYNILESARLHFVKFETSQMEQCLDYVRHTLGKTDHQSTNINVTGGGAYKYADLINEKLDLAVTKVDEMDCICAGANFLLCNIADESYVYNRAQDPRYRFDAGPKSKEDLFPYLLVTIGSGVSVLKVNSETSFERIGGTATGGGTFWGLGRLLTGAKGFDELLEMATHGDFRNVDMLVQDIYGDRGDEYTSLGLEPTLIASSFGKAVQEPSSNGKRWTDADMARSLLYMVSNDVGQIATLYALLHGIKSIYFGGFFLRHHPVGLHTISYAVNFWSKGQVQAHFLRHEGYLGALGAFLKGATNTCGTDRYSWTENLYGSSAFASVHSDHLEIDRFEAMLSSCPLLKDTKNYKADTVDLSVDTEARTYWLQCFEDSLPKFAQRAVASQAAHSEDADERANQFQHEFLNRLHTLKSQPFAHGNLTVRSLLDMREHCLSEFDFHDPYVKQKQMENEQALALLPERLSGLHELEADWDKLQEQLAIGLLAGNVFDWGAKEVALLLESGKGLKFEDALAFVRPRPWLVDDLDEWKERLRSGPIHKCAAVFIDNSGVDVILGVIPFVQELLRRGTDVLLCANHHPVLNDVTYEELQLILERAAKVSPVIEQALQTKQLTCINSGQSSPCLDLARLNKDLVDAMVDREVDLLVLEGMGRAIHTNLYAQFNCDCVKVAVLKNRWLAERLGGEMFAVVFKYEKAKEDDKSSNGL